MNGEQLMGAVLAASPAMRKKLEAVLNGTDTQATSGKQDTRLVTISGAARLLNVGRNVVHNLVKSERLDRVDLNGSKRITMRSLTEFLNGERPANAKTAEIIAASKARYAANVASKQTKEVR